MKFLADLLVMVFWGLLERLGFQLQQKQKDQETIAEEGRRAEEAAEDAVSEVTDQPFEKPNSGELAPIKEGKIVRTIKKASDYFKHRRNRKRP